VNREDAPVREGGLRNRRKNASRGKGGGRNWFVQHVEVTAFWGSKERKRKSFRSEARTSMPETRNAIVEKRLKGRGGATGRRLEKTRKGREEKGRGGTGESQEGTGEALTRATKGRRSGRGNRPKP